MCSDVFPTPPLCAVTCLPPHPRVQSTDGVSDVVDLMSCYCLTREDWDGIVEVCQFPGRPELVSRIPSKVTTASLPRVPWPPTHGVIWCVEMGYLVEQLSSAVEPVYSGHCVRPRCE